MITPYNLNNFNFVDKAAKKLNKKVAIQRTATIFDLIWNEKHPQKDVEKQGVYKIPVERKATRSATSYIGVITRTLAQRIDEHKIDLNKGRLMTALAIKAYSSDLQIKWDKAEII